MGTGKQDASRSHRMSVEAGKRTGEPSNPMGGAGGKTRWKNPMWGSSKAPPEDVEKPKTKTQKFSGGTLPSDRGKQIPRGSLSSLPEDKNLNKLRRKTKWQKTTTQCLSE